MNRWKISNKPGVTLEEDPAGHYVRYEDAIEYAESEIERHEDESQDHSSPYDNREEPYR